MKARHIIPVFLICMFAGVSSGYSQQTAEQLYQSGLYKEEIEGQLDAAIKIYQTIISQYPENRPVAAKTYLHIGLCNEKLGNAEARKAYEHVVSDFADQTEPNKVAKERLSAIIAGGGVTTSRTDVLMHRILKTDNGYNPIAGISQDGKYVILNKNGDLWLHNLQSGEQRQITHEASWVDWSFAYGNASAYISKDGKWMVYCWENGSFGEIRLSSIDGSSMQVLHNDQDGIQMKVCGWMPDGHQILTVSYNMKDRTYQLYLFSLVDKAIHKIGQSFREESTILAFARPSPDGRYIAYSKEDDIYIFDIKMGQESVLVENPAIDALSGWTPDGSGIVFVSNRTGTYDLYLLKIENGKPKGELLLLRRDFGPNGGSAITQEGKLYRIEQIGSGSSFTVPIDKQTGKPVGMPSLVDPNFPGVEGPNWSADGRFLYYEIYRNLENEQLLFIRSEETGQTHEVILKPKLSFWYRPVLSPDGRQFIVTGNSGEVNNNFGVFIIDVESGDVKQLAKITDSESGDLVDPCQNWSPDSKAVFYKIRSPEKSEEFIIHCKDLTTDENKEIYRGFHTREMKISPDGTRFAYFRNDKQNKSYIIGILDIKSGKELELGRFPVSNGTGEITSCSWTPDGKYILVDKDLGHGSELWRFPSTGGLGEKLHFFPDGGYGFILNPGGDKMAFTRYQVNWELWALENFLPK